MATAPISGKSLTRSLGGAVGQTAKSGGAPRTPTLNPDTASATCTEAETVQESLWNRNPSPRRSRHRPWSPLPLPGAAEVTAKASPCTLVPVLRFHSLAAWAASSCSLARVPMKQAAKNSGLFFHSVTTLFYGPSETTWIAHCDVLLLVLICQKSIASRFQGGVPSDLAFESYMRNACSYPVVVWHLPDVLN